VKEILLDFYKELDEHEKAIEIHFKIVVNIDQIELQPTAFWNLGQASVNYFILKQNKKAWKILDEHKEEKIFEMFTEPEELIIVDAARHTIGYIKSGKKDSFLEQLSPDEAIAVKAIVEEGKL